FEPQIVKNAHLRNQYQKIGMFGSPDIPVVINSGDNGFKGDQVRGFGFFHDGSVDTVFRFVSATAFDHVPDVNPDGFPVALAGDAMRRDMESFLLAFPSNLKPIVGQQITLTTATAPAVGARITLLEQRASAGDCELVAKAHLAGHERGFLYAG